MKKRTTIILLPFWEFYIKLLYNNQILKYDHKFYQEYRNVVAVLGHIYKKIMSLNEICWGLYINLSSVYSIRNSRLYPLITINVASQTNESYDWYK